MGHLRLLVAASLIAAGGVVPVAAGAQTPSYATRGETIRGTISSVESLTHILVADDRGFTDDVTLRRGAEVSANGVRLEPGQRVTISGSAAGPTFLATRIATSGRSYADSAYAPQSTAYAVPPTHSTSPSTRSYLRTSRRPMSPYRSAGWPRQYCRLNRHRSTRRFVTATSTSTSQSPAGTGGSRSIAARRALRSTRLSRALTVGRRSNMPCSRA